MARIGYARVSTTGQNLDMQIAALEKSNCDRIFVEKVSGVKERPEREDAIWPNNQTRHGQLPHQDTANCHIKNRPTVTLKIGQLSH